MTQNKIIKSASLAFNDSLLIGQPPVNILQLQFTLDELAGIDYIEIHVDGIKKVISLIK